jgi:hypothetical protein
MSRKEPSANVGSVALDILSYLENHPDASDTLDGIATWWSVKHGATVDRTTLQNALNGLLAKDLVERVTMPGRSYIRIKRKV